jgi:DNA repair protein RadA/Sms
MQETVAPAAAPAGRTHVSQRGAPPAETTAIENVALEDDSDRVKTGIPELDRVLGGGLVSGFYALLAGEPGSGKSTLSNQLLVEMRRAGRNVFVTSGEESKTQIKMRLNRLTNGDIPDGMQISTETCAERIYATIMGGNYDIAVIDSVNTVFSEVVGGEPGGMAQMSAAAAIFQRAAKDSGTPIILIGQVTKDNTVAGPRKLEHAVDAFLIFEGDRHDQYRILRAMKNRFGATDEIGVFEMTGNGLEAITDPSRLFLNDRSSPASGVVITCALEGSRPVFCELQALTNPVYHQGATPMRSATGVDRSRMTMLLAVMQRKARFRKIGQSDVFLNIANGLKVIEPSIDLAVCVAVASAMTGRPVRDKLCVMGEVSLVGDVRKVPQAERRQKEAERQGLETPIFEGELRTIIEQCLASEVLDAPEPELELAEAAA